MGKQIFPSKSGTTTAMPLMHHTLKQIISFQEMFCKRNYNYIRLGFKRKSILEGIANMYQQFLFLMHFAAIRNRKSGLDIISLIAAIITKINLQSLTRKRSRLSYQDNFDHYTANTAYQPLP